ncbi:MAG: hypothetical protein AB8B94_09455 [Hyphomicrobiales bacterium]
MTTVTTLLRPELLAKNSFLNSIASHEILGILIVILTVTMASIGNIHLSLGRIRGKLAERGKDISAEISLARTELSENAWYLFGAFCIMIVALVVKGSTQIIFWVSAVHSLVLIVLVLNLAILYDIYRSVFMLSALDDIIYPGQSGDDGSDAGNI